MIRRAHQHSITAGGTRTFPLFALVSILATWLPQQAQAHGTEFIMARMRLMEGGSTVELRLVVDYSGNPLIADESAAHEALENALLIKHGEETSRYTDLGSLEFHHDGTLEEAVPPSLLPPPDDQDHNLLTAVWRWHPDTPEIAFTVAKGNRHDVLIWQQPPEGDVKSVLLLGGDVSPVVQIQPARLLRWPWAAWLMPPVAAAGLLIALRKRHHRGDG